MNNQTTLAQRANLPPYSQEAEEAVIGAIISNPGALHDVAAFLESKGFYLLRHQHIWNALIRLDERGEPIDLLTVSEELKNMGVLDEIGSVAYLMQLVNNTPTSIHAEAYGQLVVRTAIRRHMLRVGDEIKALALNGEITIQQAYLEGLQRYDAIQVHDRQQFLPGSLSIQSYDETLEDLIRRNRAGEMLGYPLPPALKRLSEALPVLLPGHLVVVSGTSGSGKSALMEQLAEWYASLGLLCYYAHTEMSTNDLLHRRMARHSGIPFHLLATGSIQDAQYPTLLDADVEIKKFTTNIAYHWLPDVEFSVLATQMRRAAEHGVKIFFLDHFQDVKPPSKGTSDVRAFEEMCVWLNAFAEHRHVLVIVASQQNQRGDTKWTKKLTEKASVWIGVKRERLLGEYVYTHEGVEVRAQKGEDTPVVDVSINKARFGKKAKLKMIYHGPRFMYLDMSQVKLPKPISIESGKIIPMDEAAQRLDDAGAGEAAKS